jgi:RNA polymerase sigma factor (sigma-70 family)
MDAGDSQIVALLATDLKHSYEQLVSTYWHRLKAFILRHVGSPQDAEDIVQEAFVRAYYALEAYPEQRILALKVRPWLYKITWSVYCNHIDTQSYRIRSHSTRPKTAFFLNYKMMDMSSRRKHLKPGSAGAN